MQNLLFNFKLLWLLVWSPTTLTTICCILAAGYSWSILALATIDGHVPPTWLDEHAAGCGRVTTIFGELHITT